MREEADAMMLVRAELCERLAALRIVSSRIAARDFAAAIAAIRCTAAAYGLTPVVRLAEALERAPLAGECRRATELYLDRLGDAIGCARLDEAASEALLASVSVRLGA